MARRMSRNRRSATKNAELSPKKNERRTLLWVGSVVVLAGAAAVGFLVANNREFQGKRGVDTEKPVQITGPVTFSTDIAPVVSQYCAGCHHSGASGPFELLTYADVKKRAKDIARVTAARIMPPWQPEHGYGDFEGERRL